MRQHPLFFFFLMAYAFSWILLIPSVLSAWGILPGDFTVMFVLHTFGPALAAILMTGIVEGRAGLLSLRQRIRQWRAGWQWYLFSLVGIPALILFGIVVQPGALASFQGLTPSLPSGLGVGRWVRKLAGAASPFPACNLALARCGEPCSWVSCGPSGICLNFLCRLKGEVRAPAWLPSS